MTHKSRIFSCICRLVPSDPLDFRYLGQIIFKSEILLKCSWLRVTILHSRVKAIAPIRVSLSPMV